MRADERAARVRAELEMLTSTALGRLARPLVTAALGHWLDDIAAAHLRTIGEVLAEREWRETDRGGCRP